MAQLGNTFDANSVEPATPQEVIPAGKYLARIIASDMVGTKDGQGRYLDLEFEIIDGPFARRRFWEKLNLVNKNVQAVEIAQRALSAICHAVGVLKVSDSEALHDKAMWVILKVRPAQGEYGPQNTVGGYEAAGGAARAAAPQTHGRTPAATAAAPAQAAKPAAAPWRRNAA